MPSSARAIALPLGDGRSVPLWPNVPDILKEAMDWSDFIFWWLEWPVKIGVVVILVITLVILLNNFLLWALRCAVIVSRVHAKTGPGLASLPILDNKIDMNTIGWSSYKTEYRHDIDTWTAPRKLGG